MLADSEIHVWQAALDPEAHPALDWQTSLSPDEQKRAARYLAPRDQLRYRIGRALLRRILGHYLGLPAAAVRFEYGTQGKPALAQEFQLSGLEFNLAHTADFLVLGVIRGRPLGVDVERLRLDMAIEAMAERFFAPREVAELHAIDPSRRREAFFTIWARKEAYLKARGSGLSAALDSFLVSTHPDEPPPVYLVESPIDEPVWHLYPLRLPGTYFGAACTDRAGLTVRYMNEVPLKD